MARKRRAAGLHFYIRKKPLNSRLIGEIFSWILGIIIAVALAVGLNYWLGMTTHVVGVSMEPTLVNGQQIFVNRLSFLLSEPDPGDVVLFLPNGNKNAHYYVKRVVAVPGDKVLIREGILYVNGEPSDLISMHIADPGIADSELVLRKDEYFCIGDSPSGSEDSRSANIGMVSKEDMIGRVWFRLGTEENDGGFVK